MASKSVNNAMKNQLQGLGPAIQAGQNQAAALARNAAAAAAARNAADAARNAAAAANMSQLPIGLTNNAERNAAAAAANKQVKMKERAAVRGQAVANQRVELLRQEQADAAAEAAALAASSGAAPVTASPESLSGNPPPPPPPVPAPGAGAPPGGPGAGAQPGGASYPTIEVTVRVPDANGALVDKQFLVLNNEPAVKAKRQALYTEMLAHPPALFTALQADMPAGSAQLYGGRRHKKHSTRKGRKAQHGKRKQTRQRK